MTRSFRLLRHHDVSGVSGEGYVGRGFVADDGHVAFRWFGERASWELCTSMANFEWAHCHSGKSEIVWDHQGGAA